MTTPLFNRTLSRGSTLLAAEFGYAHADLARLARQAFVYSAAPAAVKALLLAEFDAWWAGMEPG